MLIAVFITEMVILHKYVYLFIYLFNEHTQEFHPHNQKLEPPCTVY